MELQLREQEMINCRKKAWSYLTWPTEVRVVCVFLVLVVLGNNLLSVSAVRIHRFVFSLIVVNNNLVTKDGLQTCNKKYAWHNYFL